MINNIFTIDRGIDGREVLLQAQQNAAMLTTFNEVNMQNVIDLRKQYQDRFTAKHNVKLGFMW
jgi:2-oxoglutarate dehydrogenase E2 component (dihydrolipoamide succinyltransferase)